MNWNGKVKNCPIGAFERGAVWGAGRVGWMNADAYTSEWAIDIGNGRDGVGSRRSAVERSL